jgi:hypothetical protein
VKFGWANGRLSIQALVLMPFVHCCFFAEFFTPFFSGFFCCLPRGFRWPFWRAWQGWVTAVGGASIQPLFPGAFDAVVDSAIAPSLTDDDFTASLPGLSSFFAFFSYLNLLDFYLTYFLLLFRFIPCGQRLTFAILARPEFMDTFACGFFASC